jgi:hypothetical protein
MTSFVTTAPPEMVASAGGLAAIGTTVASANGAAAGPLMAVIPPAPEPTSVLNAAMFLSHGAMFQGMQAMGSAVHAMFVETLGVSAGSYAITEGANTLAAL